MDYLGNSKMPKITETCLSPKIWGIGDFSLERSEIAKFNNLSKTIKELRMTASSIGEKYEHLINEVKMDRARRMNSINYEEERKNTLSHFTKKKTLLENEIKTLYTEEVQRLTENLNKKKNDRTSFAINEIKRIKILKDDIQQYVSSMDIELEHVNLGDIDYENIDLDEVQQLLDATYVYIKSQIKKMSIDSFDKIEQIANKKLKDENMFKAFKILTYPAKLVTDITWGSVQQQKNLGELQDSIKKVVKNLSKLNSLLDNYAKYISKTSSIDSDTKDFYDKEVSRIREYYKVKKDKDLKDIERERENALKNLSANDEQTIKLRISKECNDKIQSYEMAMKSEKADLDEKIRKLTEDLNKSKEEFERAQQTPNLFDEKDLYYGKLKKDIKEKILKHKDFNLVKDLKLILDLSNEEKNSLGWTTIEGKDLKSAYHPDYDLEYKIKKLEGDIKLKSEIDNLRREVEYMNSIGETQENLEAQLKKVTEEENSIYLMRTKMFVGEKFHLGINSGLVEYEYVDFGLQSVAIIYEDSISEEESVLLVKNIIIQYELLHHPHALKVNIITPDGSPMFSDCVTDTSKIDNGEVKPGENYVQNYSSAEDINELFKKEDERIIKSQNSYLRGKEFNDYLIDFRKNGSKTEPYIINVLFRNDMNTPFKKFSENSVINGIKNIHLIDRTLILDNKGEISKEAERYLSKFDNIIETVKYNNNVLFVNFNKVHKRYKIFKPTEDMRKPYIELTKYSEERFKKASPPLLVTEDLIEAVTGGDYMKMSAKKSIKLYLGFKDGDLSKPEPVVLDEVDRPHGFFAGATGGGKSNALAVMNNVIKACYSPEELAVFYFDFKVVEVMMHASPYTWPNCMAMTGTSAPEYLISMINWIIEENDRRYKLFAQYGVVKLSEFWDKIDELKEEYIKAGKPDEANKLIKPPRVMLLIDEAVEGFSISEEVATALGISLEKLGRVSRASGIHMLIVSQAPEGKIKPNLMNHLKVRGCTKAGKEVSKEVIGNTFVAEPENQFMGFFGVNKSGSGDPNMNVRLVVPYNKPESSQRFNKITAQLCEQRGIRRRNPVIFMENEPYKLDRFELDMKKFNYELNQVPIGEPVLFKLKRELKTINFKLDDKNNLMIFSSSGRTRMNMTKTILRYLKYKGIFTIPVFCKNEYPDELKEDDFNLFDKALPYYVTPEDADDWIIGKADSELGSLASIVATMKEQIAERGTKKSEIKPKFIILFDIDKAKCVTTTYQFDSKTFGNLANEANNLGFFLIYVVGDDRFVSKVENNTGHILAADLGKSDLGKEFKNIEPAFAKYVNVLEATESCKVKMPKENVERLNIMDTVW